MKNIKMNSRVAALLAVGAVTAILFYPVKATPAASPNTTTLGTVLSNDSSVVMNPGRPALLNGGNVLPFKQIRAVFQAALGNCSATLVQYDSNGSPIAVLDNFGGPNQDCSFTKTYDTPGASVGIQFVNNAATADTFRFLVYGQPYESITTK